MGFGLQGFRAFRVFWVYSSRCKSLGFSGLRVYGIRVQVLGFLGGSDAAPNRIPTEHTYPAV